MDTNPATSVPEVILSSSGRRMPLLGMGTATSPLIGSGATKSAVVHAIELGYRHFDTATLYQTEEPLGEAIAEAIELGLIKSRDELFVTSKLWCSDAHPDLVLLALQKSLHHLQLEYLDLYLIHWPVSSRPEGVWGAMEECQKMGLTKNIGVSNFTCKKLTDLLAIAKIPPAVNQVEINPLWQQKKLRDYCKSNGIVLSAYAPLGSNRVLENEVLGEIAKAKGKTVAQVCLRWAYEQEVCVVVKSFNQERMKENLDIFSWAFTEEENRKLGEIPQSRGCLGQDYISDQGPFKTIEELWDGEM
ncbi:Non-functional NADPH-dependent codeinone reductase 2 [Linum perenne]